MSLEPGLDIILWLQSRPDWFLSTMRWASILGRGGFYLLAALLVFWAWDRKFGTRLIIAITFGGVVNSLLKMGLHMPRPYWLDSRIHPLELHSSFGMPSGHAQTAVLAWGSMAWSVGRGWAWIVALVALLTIGLSRVALGVHSPAQVLVGWTVGFVLLAGFVWFERSLMPSLLHWRTTALALMVISAASIALGVGIAIHWALKGWSVPNDWAERAGRSFGSDPVSLKDLFRSTGALLGFALGAIWTWRAGRWAAPRGWWARLVEVIVGTVGLGTVLLSGILVHPAGHMMDLWFLGTSGLAGFWASGPTPLLAAKVVGLMQAPDGR